MFSSTNQTVLLIKARRSPLIIRKAIYYQDQGTIQKTCTKYIISHNAATLSICVEFVIIEEEADFN